MFECFRVHESLRYQLPAVEFNKKKKKVIDRQFLDGLLVLPETTGFYIYISLSTRKKLPPRLFKRNKYFKFFKKKKNRPLSCLRIAKETLK